MSDVDSQVQLVNLTPFAGHIKPRSVQARVLIKSHSFSSQIQRLKVWLTDACVFSAPPLYTNHAIEQLSFYPMLDMDIEASFYHDKVKGARCLPLQQPRVYCDVPAPRQQCIAF